IPTVDISLNDVLEKDKLVIMSFANVQGKNGTSIRAAMSGSVNKYKDQNFNSYKHKVRNTEVIMGLFYASSISITVNRTISNKAELEAKLGSLPNVNLQVDMSDVNTYTYTLSNSNTPFAASFIDGRDI